MSYRGKFNIIVTPPYASDLYSELYNEKTAPTKSAYVVTEEGLFVITEDGNRIVTE